MKNILLLIFLVKFSFLSAQKTFFTDSLDFTQENNVLRSFANITMVNDLNYLFLQKSNDEGYTLGTFLDVRLVNQNRSRYFGISFVSNLYTDFQDQDTYYVDDRKVIPQKFTEISYGSFSFNQYFQKPRLILSAELGVGVRNKNKAIPGLALWYQGGNDGMEGVHGMLIGQHATENVTTGGIKPFVFIRPSVIKKFSLITPRGKLDKQFFELESGFSLGTSEIQSTAFLSIYSETPLFQLYQPKYKLLELKIISKALTTAHSNGVLFNPEIGAEASFWIIRVAYTSIFNIGNQQVDVVNYYDDESQMRFYVKFDI